MTVTIRQALQNVANYPEPVDDDWLAKPAHELVCRSLFQIANSGNPQQRGSMAKANRARKMILERLGGKRRAGTKPTSKTGVEITFVDLTGGELSGSGNPVDDERDGQGREGAGALVLRDPGADSTGVGSNDDLLRGDPGTA